MSNATNKALAREFIERAFNEGDISIIDQSLAPNSIDHQEPPGTDFGTHLKGVVAGLRTAFPDLHFEIHDMIAEGDIVAFRSTMTGTHLGEFNLGPVRGYGATGRKISVAHLHYIRMIDGKTTDLWHQWDIPMMMRQLGIVQQRQPA